MYFVEIPLLDFGFERRLRQWKYPVYRGQVPAGPILKVPMAAGHAGFGSEFNFAEWT
jgi:hypothetical protein